MLNLDRIKTNKRGYVVDPKNCIGCIFRFSSGGRTSYTACTLYEQTGMVPEANSRGKCKRKIEGRRDGSAKWRKEGAGRLKK